MPVAAIGQAIGQLDAGATSFTFLMFDAEAASAVFKLDVKQLESDALPKVPPALKPVPEPPGRSWPVQITVKGLGQQAQKPVPVGTGQGIQLGCPGANGH